MNDDDWVWVLRREDGLFINSYYKGDGSPWPWVYPMFYDGRPAWNEPLDMRFDRHGFMQVRCGDLDALLAMERARLAMEGV